jgi:hypothetical protein
MTSVGCHLSHPLQLLQAGLRFSQFFSCILMVVVGNFQRSLSLPYSLDEGEKLSGKYHQCSISRVGNHGSSRSLQRVEV